MKSKSSVMDKHQKERMKWEDQNLRKTENLEKRLDDGDQILLPNQAAFGLNDSDTMSNLAENDVEIDELDYESDLRMLGDEKTKLDTIIGFLS